MSEVIKEKTVKELEDHSSNEFKDTVARDKNNPDVDKDQSPGSIVAKPVASYKCCNDQCNSVWLIDLETRKESSYDR